MILPVISRERYFRQFEFLGMKSEWQEFRGNIAGPCRRVVPIDSAPRIVSTADPEGESPGLFPPMQQIVVLEFYPEASSYWRIEDDVEYDRLVCRRYYSRWFAKGVTTEIGVGTMFNYKICSGT